MNRIIIAIFVPCEYVIHAFPDSYLRVSTLNQGLCDIKDEVENGLLECDAYRMANQLQSDTPNLLLIEP